MTKTMTIKTYTVYDKDNKLIGAFGTITDLMKAFHIRSTSNIYMSSRYGIYFKPNKETNREIRVAILTEVIQEDTAPRNTAEIINLVGEKWKEIPGYPNNYASNLGRFKYDDGDNKFFLTITYTKNGTPRRYRDVSIRNGPNYGDGIHKYRTSRVLAKTWIDNTLGLAFKDDKRVVDHIDNNSENEKIENLRILANNGENIRAAVYEQGVKMGKPSKRCYAYNINTKEEREYESTKNLVKDIWGRENNGYFCNYYANKLTTKSGWRVGYDIEEIKSR